MAHPSLVDFRSLANAAEEAAGTEAGLEGWREVISMAERHPALLFEDRVPYVLGLAHYQLVGLHPGAESECEKHLRLALDQHPDDHYSLLYLGHLAYDAARYTAALEWFDQIPGGAFASCDRMWRDLKLQELRICCLAHVGETESLVREFEVYLSIAAKCEETDVLTVFELPKLLAAWATAHKEPT